MDNEIYLIHLDDYLSHIDGKLEMYDLLLELVRSVRILVHHHRLGDFQDIGRDPVQLSHSPQKIGGGRGLAGRKSVRRTGRRCGKMHRRPRTAKR